MQNKKKYEHRDQNFTLQTKALTISKGETDSHLHKMACH